MPPNETSATDMQISYNNCFRQICVLPTILADVLRLSLGKKRRLFEFLPSDLITNKRIDKVPTLRYIFMCIFIKHVLSTR